MGPGARRDTLDDHFGDWNWKKITMLGRTLLRKLKNAVVSAKVHHEELMELESAIDDASLMAWKSEVETWEADSTQHNPFESKVARE
jgi:hypothetical protein